MENLILVNGNKQNYKRPLPKIEWITGFINKVALAHIKENTGLSFKKTAWTYEVQPTNSQQIVKLLMTYDFKTQYYDNTDHKNVIFIKKCTGEDFKD